MGEPPYVGGDGLERVVVAVRVVEVMGDVAQLRDVDAEHEKLRGQPDDLADDGVYLLEVVGVIAVKETDDVLLKSGDGLCPLPLEVSPEIVLGADVDHNLDKPALDRLGIFFPAKVLKEQAHVIDQLQGAFLFHIFRLRGLYRRKGGNQYIILLNRPDSPAGKEKQ